MTITPAAVTAARKEIAAQEDTSALPVGHHVQRALDESANDRICISHTDAEREDAMRYCLCCLLYERDRIAAARARENGAVRTVGKLSAAQKELAEKISNDIAEGIDCGETRNQLRMAVSFWADIAAKEAIERTGAKQARSMEALPAAVAAREAISTLFV